MLVRTTVTCWLWHGACNWGAFIIAACLLLRNLLTRQAPLSKRFDPYTAHRSNWFSHYIHASSPGSLCVACAG